MTMPTKRHLVPMFVGLLLGLGIAFTVRAQNQVRQQTGVGRNREELVSQLIGVTDETQRLRAELRRLEEAATQQTTWAQLHDEVQIERISSGVEEVQGSGVLVMMVTNPMRTNTKRQMTDTDVLLLLNDLRAAGAEAMAINGVRVTPHLTISQEGSGTGPILVNGQPALGMVVIEAVGDPQLMMTSLHMRGGVVQQMAPWVQVTITKSTALTIPAVAQIPQYRYARPLR